MIRRYSFAEIVDVLAANYAAEQLRTHQRWAQDSGSSLSSDRMVELFNRDYAYMHDRIQGTSATTVEGEDVTAPRLTSRKKPPPPPPVGPGRLDRRGG